MNGNRHFSKKLILSLAVGLMALAPLQALAANKLIVKGTDGTTDKFVVTDQGFVGIGSTSIAGFPLRPLHIVGDTTNNTPIISALTATNPNGGGGFITYHNNANGALPNAGDRLGYFLFGTYDVTPGPATPRAINGAGIVARTEGAWTSDGNSALYFPSYFAFETTASTVRTEKMRITGSGNVGIGTTAPTQTLEVNGGARLNTVTAQPACDTNSRGTLWFVKGSPDTLQVCISTDNGTTFAWKTVTLTP